MQITTPIGASRRRSPGIMNALQAQPSTRPTMCPSRQRHFRGAMIDRGANGGIAGSDTRRSATLVALSTLLGLMITSSIHLHRFGRSGRLHHLGPAIVILNQYGWYPAGGTSIHSSGQMEHFGNIVDAR
jgi:hypothetical protein